MLSKFSYQQIADTTLPWLFYAFVVSIPLSQFISTRLMVLCFFIAILQPWDRSQVKEIFKHSWDIFLYLSVLAIGLLYTMDMQTGLQVMESNFGFFALPFIFSRLRLTEIDHYNRLLVLLVVGIIISGTIYISVGLFEFTLDPSKNWGVFYEAISVLDFDPTYVAYFIVLAITLLLYNVFTTPPTLLTVICVLIITVLFVVLSFSNVKMAFIALLMVFSYFVLKFLLEQKSSWRWALFFFILLMTFFSFFIFQYFDFRADLYVKDSGERFSLWVASIRANTDYFFGIGTGDYKIILADYYTKHLELDFLDRMYNAHNQWLHLFLTNGVLGVIALLILIGRPLYSAAKWNHLVGVLIFFPFLVYSMSEVVLSRYQGLILIALLHQVIIWQVDKFKSQNINP